MKRLIIVSATVVAILLLYFFFDARVGDVFPNCPFNTITGFFCPGCGSQRALSALLHGDVFQAVSFNPLMVLSLPLLIYSAVVYTINVFATTPVQQKIFYSPVFIKTVLVVVVAFGILRNVPVYPFNLLAPH